MMGNRRAFIIFFFMCKCDILQYGHKMRAARYIRAFSERMIFIKHTYCVLALYDYAILHPNCISRPGLFRSIRRDVCDEIKRCLYRDGNKIKKFFTKIPWYLYIYPKIEYIEETLMSARLIIVSR